MFPRLFSGIAPYFIVNEYPKSGGTWIGLMLADALDLPFPRHRPLGIGKCICHGHFLHPYFLRNVVVVWRDPRDVMVSFYYHCFFVNELGNGPFVSDMRRRLPFADYNDIRANLARFVDLMCTRPPSPRFTWARFASHWAVNSSAVTTRYEDMRLNTAKELQRVVWQLAGKRISDQTATAIADRHDFTHAKKTSEALRNGTPGAEIGFVREGSVGGWRNHFSEDAFDRLLRHCGEGMVALGYEL